MTPQELRHYLSELKLSQLEASRLLSVDGRTVRRWIDGSATIPGPAEQALRAWIRLQRRGLAWRPDSETLGENEIEIAKQVALLRDHNIGLADILNRVEARGGPKKFAVVDLKEKTASLGPIEVGFYALPNGSFSPANYRRKDGPPDEERDQPILEDIYYCIAQAVAKAGSGWFLH